jgi:hypothetical protein
MKMKTLTLVCNSCEKRRVFRGDDVDAIIVAIETANWQDYSGSGRTMSPGEMPGDCPDCLKAREEGTEAKSDDLTP